MSFFPRSRLTSLFLPLTPCRSSFAGPSRLPFRPRLATNTVSCRCLSTTPAVSSGHNRWSKIRHKKGAADSARGALFARLSREIITAMRPPSSPDPMFNSKLATALQRAKEQGLTKIGIENAMAKARSAADGSGQSVVYEAVAPGGKVVMLVECLTSNPARTVKRVKEILSKNGARTSPVLFMFEKKGLITLTPIKESTQAGFEHLFDIAVENGAEDVREVTNDEGGVEFEISTPQSALSPLTHLLSSAPHTADYSLDSSELIFLPTDPVPILSEGQTQAEEGAGEGVTEEVAEGVFRVVDLLEEENDVVKVWTNLADDD
ncbi:mitochondrial protein [Kwoniella heveanensis CBS 569]|uniref:Mitochondrial protein n=1 Tax=Kwoniella heveanensis BCC8398 TaxID=1296120 RepID=A0A1B9GNS8_9TREE|nr:mitochondrial protein [Kwoniella heveanensis BCC8398]OCF44017.1 mitochondrial protein [Kwoniella heveanensis CBS 569]